MPLKDGRKVCVTHINEELSPVQANEDIHILSLGAVAPDGYALLTQATGLNAYACKICGYVEFYLIENKLDALKKVEK